MMTGMLMVACILIGYVAWFMFKLSNDADLIIEEKMRQIKSDTEEILNRLDK